MLFILPEKGRNQFCPRKYYIENEIYINEKIHINKPACVVGYFEIIKTS